MSHMIHVVHQMVSGPYKRSTLTRKGPQHFVLFIEHYVKYCICISKLMQTLLNWHYSVNTIYELDEYR